MAPRNPTGRGAATTVTDSTDTMSEIPTDAQEAFQLLQAENERLRAKLATQADRTQSPTQTAPELVAVLEALMQQLRQSPPTDRLHRSAKISDPPVLTDGVNPTFDNWKIQLQDKLKVNTDHFPTEEARKAFVFACTGGDAQTHLRPRYSDDSVDPFLLAKDMIGYLASIYKDPYKVQNARYDYKGLRMKTTEKFTEFQTRFLQLAGQARIPPDDLMPDLFDKLTLELRRTILPQYSTMTTLKQLTDQCQAVDQGLRRIKAESDRLQKNQAFTEPYRAKKALTELYGAQGKSTEHHRSGTPDRNRGLTPTSWRARSANPTYAPRTPDPMQGNTTQCYTCGQEGHYAKECTAGIIKTEVALVHDSYEDSGLPASESEEELEVVEPGKEQP
jgi:hypothetical protein